MKMRRKALMAITVTLAVVLMSMMLISVAYATKLLPVSGTIIITGYNYYYPDPAGKSDNVIVYLGLKGSFAGSIVGSYTSESRWVRHNVGAPDTWTNIHGVDTLPSATVMGKTGGLEILIEGKAPGGGTWQIISGTGDLANLHGQGTFSTTASPLVLNYEGQVHFDP